MKIVSARDAKEGFAERGDLAQRDPILVTRYGRPYVLLLGVEGKDIEQIMLGMDDELWETIERRREHSHTISDVEFRRSLGMPPWRRYHHAPAPPVPAGRSRRKASRLARAGS